MRDTWRVPTPTGEMTAPTAGSGIREPHLSAGLPEHETSRGDARTVTAVIVTYGDRGGMCSRAVDAALAAGAERVIVVDNGSAPSSRTLLQQYLIDSRVLLVSLGENRGSAGGFQVGLDAALGSAGDGLIWLLDDDNRARPEALSALRTVLSVREALFGPMVAVVALRPERHHLAAVAAGTPASRIYASPSSFLEFSVRDLPWRLKARYGSPEVRGGVREPAVEIPYAPYGGLLLSANTIRGMGLPNSELFVYEDDTEWTYRLTRAGGRIFVVPASVVDEMDSTWYGDSSGGFFYSRLLRTTNPSRLYYYVRNRVNFEAKHQCSSRVLYVVNAAVILATMGSMAVFLRKLGVFRTVVRAVKDGQRGDLGVRADVGSVARTLTPSR